MLQGHVAATSPTFGHTLPSVFPEPSKFEPDRFKQDPNVKVRMHALLDYLNLHFYDTMTSQSPQRPLVGGSQMHALLCLAYKSWFSLVPAGCILNLSYIRLCAAIVMICVN